MPNGRLPPTIACVRRWLVVGAAAWAVITARGAPVDFAREIQPLLAGKCYDCHGPEKSKGGLRLNTRADAFRGGKSGEAAIVAGQGPKSPLIQRLVTADENDVMPQKAERLAAAEIDLLRRWIDEGAAWPENLRHWAYVAPVQPAVPSVGGGWPAAVNAIDGFVFARLQREGLAPSPATDKARWLRRVSLDLIGLPPSPAERAAFLADASSRAYERVVDRLLASPAYGERWARPWLDLARYADSHGFQRDDLRDLWPYRDWVIRSLNADMPFDQFTTWQIAGDLLPEAKSGRNLEPLVATGFHRAAPTNVEAGTDQEEGRVNQVFDRVNTTGAVWLGTTLECAQCHNHKYDPFPQKDYYRLFAYFNQSEQETAFASAKAMATLKFTGPFLTLPDPAQETKRPALAAKADAIDAQIAARTRELATRQPAWEEAVARAVAVPAQEHALTVTAFESVGEAGHRMLPDQSVLLVDDLPETDTYYLTVHTALTDITGFKLETLTDPSLPGTGPGRGSATQPNFVLNNFRVTVTPPGGEARPVAFTQARASFSQARYSVENLLRTDNGARSGWAVSPQLKRSHWAVFTTDRPLGEAGGLTLTFCLEQNFGAGRTIGRLRLTALTGGSGAVTVPEEIATLLRVAPERRSAAQRAKVEEHLLATDRELTSLRQARAKVAEEAAALAGVRTLVMREIATPRPTAVLKRGNFLDRGETVAAGVPEALHAAPGTATGNRLDLARWLVDRSNPLVARVTVNRWWAEFFGRGIVPTLEDFGVKGEPPMHPELLDWLAVEFMDHGWSMKHVHRLIALSATYRQAARVTPELLARDDQNRLLARGPRFRLDAEAIRDNALAIAGLLSLKQGGPPVRPYQPPGLWESKVGGERVTYEVSTGEDAHRRGIYTVWKRSSPYPSFVNFDANARTACTVRRSRSNTPLQALTLLNDPVYVEAARGFARRVQTERSGATVAERIRYAFELALTRSPTPVETAALETLFAQQRTAHAEENVAWEAVATALLNLDELITKG